MSPLDTILGKLGQYRRVGNGYRAQCPSHDGTRTDSLSLTKGEDGAALIYCFGGCEYHRILHALGLDAPDLFPESDVRRNGALPKGGKSRYLKPPQTTEDKLILAFAAQHISGLLVDQPPTTLPDETMGQYVGLVELLSEVSQRGGQEAVRAEWVNLQPELAVSASRLRDAVNRHMRTLLGQALPGTAEAGQRIPVLRGRKVSTLLQKEFPPVHAVVPGVILEGLQLMVGKPKFGKSRLMLDIAVAVACGGNALGTLDVEPGPALYISLEDPERRLQQRFLSLLAGDASPDTLEYETAWPRLDEGGLEDLECWIACHPGARLIVIDPLKRIRPRGRSRGNAYDQDYEALQALQDLVNRHPHLAIVVIHHSNKLRDVDDAADLISGSTGLSAGADGFAILRRQRGTPDATLLVVHRDLEEEREHALKTDPLTGGWTMLGAAADYRLSPQRQAILDVLRQAEGPMSPKEIGLALGRQDEKSMSALYVLLREMLHAGDIDSPGRGHYVATSAKNAQEPKDAKFAKDTQDVLPMREVWQATELILSDARETAQDSDKHVSVEDNSGNGHENAILSDLRDLSAISSFTTADACPTCRGRDWRRRADGTPVCLNCLPPDDWADPGLHERAELEAMRQEREVSMAALHMSADNPSYCLFCETPLREGESYEIIPGAELCGECMARPDDCDTVRQNARHRAVLEHHSKSRTGDAGDKLSPTFAEGVVEKKPVPLARGAAPRGQMTGLSNGPGFHRERSSPSSPPSAEPLSPPRLRVRAGRPRRARRRPRAQPGCVTLLEGGILRFPLDVDAGGFSTSS
jgi:hypothetical protein